MSSDSASAGAKRPADTATEQPPTKEAKVDGSQHDSLKETKEEIVHAFDTKPIEGVFGRKISPVYHVRTMTNWVKSCLIRTYAHPGAKVLDLGCGHGSDLLKYANSRIGFYVGVDLSKASLGDAVRRYNDLQAVDYPAKFICADVTEQTVNRDDVLDHGLTFDITSAQEILQYCFSGEKELRTFFRNATDRLRPGGYFIGCFPDPSKLLGRLRESADKQSFGNELYHIKFHQTFDKINQGTNPYGIVYEVSLGEILHDVPEYLVSIAALDRLATEYGLQVETMMNFRDFYESYKDIPPYRGLCRAVDVPIESTQIPEAEWEIISLFTAFTFRKLEGTTFRRSPRLNEGDIIDIRTHRNTENQPTQ